MKRRTLTTIFAILMILTVVWVAVVPEPTHAAWWDGALQSVLVDFASQVSGLILTVVSFFLSICGIVLNVAIVLTLNISTLYDSIPAIKEVWIVIRNVSSIFIIFGLLYTSILKILDIGKSSIGALIKNIVIAGLLINFSLFFTKIAIDASNLVSMQFYKAIAPNSVSIQDKTDLITASFRKGGISDAFMNGLKIQTLYHDKQKILSAKDSTKIGLMILIHTYLGIFLTIVAGLSFLAAGIVFIVRIVILLLGLAFSPIYFVGMIFPTVKSETKTYVDKFVGQLIFMPAYLILLYVAMKFIAEGNFFSQVSGSTSNEDSIMLAVVGLLFRYTMAFVLINLPLLVAIKLGATGPKWAGNIQGLAQNWAKGTASWVGQNSIGRGAKRLQSAASSSGWAAKNPNLAIMTDKALSGIAGSSLGGSKGGYDKRFKDYSKSREDFLSKGIKLGDKEKDSVINSGITGWKEYDETLQKNLASVSKLAENTTMSEVGRMAAKKRKAELQAEIKARENAVTAGTQDKYLADEALKEKKDNAAKIIEKQTVSGFFTNKARKEAADAFRKEANKSDEKKMLEMLKKIQKDQDKADEKAKETPKP